MAYSLAIYGESGLGMRLFSKPDGVMRDLHLNSFAQKGDPSTAINSLAEIKTQIAIAGIDVSSLCFLTTPKSKDLKPSSVTIRQSSIFGVDVSDKVEMPPSQLQMAAAVYQGDHLNTIDYKTSIFVVRKGEDEYLTRAMVSAVMLKAQNQKPKRAFAIIVIDEPYSEEQISKLWQAEDVEITEEQKSAFKAEHSHFVQECIKDAEDQLVRLKRELIASKIFFRAVSPHLVGFLASVCLGIGCLLAFSDPAFLVPSPVAAAAEPVLMAILALSLMAVVCGGPIYGLVKLFRDYHESKDRVAFLRPNYGWLDYLADWPVRIRNWHHDHKLQAGFLYAGLLGTLAIALSIIFLGTDTSALHFIGEVVASGFQALGFYTLDPVQGAHSLQVFVAVITTFIPLAIGAFSSQCVDFAENEVYPPKANEIAESSLSEDGLGLEVRFYDGLTGIVEVSEAKNNIKTAETEYVTIQDFRYQAIVSQNPLVLRDSNSLTHELNTNEIHENLMLQKISRDVKII